VPDIFRYLQDHQNEKGSKPLNIDPDIEAELLRAALSEFNTHHELEAGMIVRQKPACHIYRSASCGQLAIVVEVFAEPISERKIEEGGTSERVDLLVAEIDRTDGDFVLHYVDSRRFEPVPEADLSPQTKREGD
jgi:hypothetical protein